MVSKGWNVEWIGRSSEIHSFELVVDADEGYPHYRLEFTAGEHGREAAFSCAERLYRTGKAEVGKPHIFFGPALANLDRVYSNNALMNQAAWMEQYK